MKVTKDRKAFLDHRKIYCTKSKCGSVHSYKEFVNKIYNLKVNHKNKMWEDFYRSVLTNKHTECVNTPAFTDHV